MPRVSVVGHGRICSKGAAGGGGLNDARPFRTVCRRATHTADTAYARAVPGASSGSNGRHVAAQLVSAEGAYSRIGNSEQFHRGDAALVS